MKQQLTEALAPRLIDPSLLPIYEAARLVERLLPGVCENCQGDPHKIDRWTCPACHGTGQVWDEGIVEAVADVLIERRITHKDQLRTFTDAVATCREDARAVLSALVELLTEKEHAPKDFHDTQGRAWGGNL